MKGSHSELQTPNSESRTGKHVLYPSLGMIVSQFPEMHETFIMRELSALRDAGIPLRIYSLKRCRDPIVHPQAQKLLGLTRYVVWNDAVVWVRAAGLVLRRPMRAFSILGWVVRHHSGRAFLLAKALVVWAQAIVIAEKMREEGITHIHAHWATVPTTAAVIASDWLGIPFSFTAHAWDIFVRNPSLKEKIRLSARVMTCTDYNRRFLQHLCPGEREKIIVNYHGVDLGKFQQLQQETRNRGQGTCFVSPISRLPSPVSCPVFLSVGRLVETKGYPVLLEAYRRLKSEGMAFHAVIVGEGCLRDRLEHQIRVNHLADVVELRNAMGQEALRKLYRDAFAFVLPCTVAEDGDRDGIPNVILEAMACSLPIVSTQISGIPEAVQDRRSGLLVPPNDGEELARALKLLLQRPSFARVLGDHGRMWAECTFDAREHMQQLVVRMRGLLEKSVRPVNVMYVIWSLEVGGAERVVMTLASGLDRKRFSPIVVCLNQEGRMAAMLKQQGITVIALNKRPGVDLGMLVRLAWLMRQHGVQVVHAHLWGANLWARIAAMMARVPVVIVHEHGMQPWRGTWHFRIDRWLGRRTSRILFASSEVMQKYGAKTGMAQRRCLWVPNGIDGRPQGLDRTRLRARLGFSDEDRVVISVGRLSPEKGHEDLLLAFAQLRQQVPQARLVLVGDGIERDTLQALQARCGLNGEVTFAGVQDDVRPWLAAADVYVQPSRREGLSLAVLEAMAFGLPVIATHVGDTARVITDGMTGYLVPAQQPEVLSAKLKQVLDQRDQQGTLVEAARALVQRDYSERQMVGIVERVYEEELVKETIISTQQLVHST